MSAKSLSTAESALDPRPSAAISAYAVVADDEFRTRATVTPA